MSAALDRKLNRLLGFSGSKQPDAAGPVPCPAMWRLEAFERRQALTLVATRLRARQQRLRGQA